MTAMEAARLRALQEEMKREGDLNWFCAGTIMHGTKLTVIRYYRHYIQEPNRFEIKFPGGKGKVDLGRNRNDQTPEDTFKAEMLEEVLRDDGVIVSYQPVIRVSVGGHKKYFCLFEPEGRLRESELFEEREVTERGIVTREKLSPPFEMDVTDLQGRLFSGHLAFLLALARVFSDNPVYGEVAEDLEYRAAKGEFRTYDLL